MKDEKKGFTLIELLGVLVLIVIIALISYIVVDKLLKDSKQKMYEKQLDAIELAVKNIMSDNNELLPTPGNPTTVALGTLKIIKKSFPKTLF